MIKAGDRVRRIDYPLYYGSGRQYEIGSEWTVCDVDVKRSIIELKELPGAWDLDKFELIKEAKMCTCNEQSGVCSECKKKYKRQELIPGKKYKHPDWSSHNTFLATTSKGQFVFEDSGGSAFNSRHTCDFEEVKEKKKGWINIYKDYCGGAVYSTKEKAKQSSSSNRIACIEVEYYEGQGL